VRVYVKLREGIWMLINKKIEQTTIAGKRRVTRYILAGERIEKPPELPENESIEVPAVVVNKLISKLLDAEGGAITIFEPMGEDYYVVKVPRGMGGLVKSMLSWISGKKTRAKGKETS